MTYRIFAPILALCCALTAAVASVPDSAPSGTDRPETYQNRFILKVDSTSRSPIEDARRLLAPVAARFGIGNVTPWLDPGLLHYGNYSPQMLKRSRGGRGASARFAALERIVVVEYTSPHDPAYVAGKAASLPGVEYAEPIFVRRVSMTPNDPFLQQQRSYLEQIRALEAWDVARGDSNIVIGIVDTGIDVSHPDLRSAIWRNPGETGQDLSGRDKRTNGLDDDGNGLIDDWIGYDFGGATGYGRDNNPVPYYGHGTHVAGIAGAPGNNGTGIAGVGFGVKLMAVKIASDAPDNPILPGGFSGILYASKMGAAVINCSWGGPGQAQSEQELIDAVTENGTLVVSAAGNESRSLPSYPASYRNVLSVASVAPNDQRSSFSNFNPSVDISAPGEAIFSTFPTTLNASGYQVEQGTSMSSPMVAGAAALVLSRYPGLGPQEVTAVLRANADDINGGNPNFAWLLGSGRLNVERALTVGPETVAADILDYSVIESVPDDVIEPGESVELRVQVQNILRASTALSLELTAINPADVQIVTPRQTFGVVASGDVRESSPGVFSFVLPANVPIDYKLPLRLTLREGDRTIGAQRIEILVNPNFATTSRNRITATFTGHGRIGYDDFPVSRLGKGFKLDRSLDLLAEGGMLIGVSPTRLADVVRAPDGNQNQWLETIEPYRLRYSQADRAEIGTARFDDAHLIDLQRVGVDIRLKTYEFTGIEQENLVLAYYTITNTSGARLDDLFAAHYFDWDIGPAGADNRTDFDPDNRLGYTSNVKDASLPFVGAVLISDQPMNFYALDNDQAPLAGGFSQREKWDAISSGIHHEVSDIGDCSMTIGAGPLSLDPGQDTTLVFAYLVAPNLAELRNSAAEARRLAGELGTRVGGPIPLPREVKLLTFGANPFTDRATIQFWMPDEGHARVAVFDAIGRRVATLVDGEYRRGIHTVEFLPPDDAPVVYFVQFDAFSETHVEKLIRLDTR